MFKTLFKKVLVTVLLAAAAIPAVMAQTVTKTFVNEPLEKVLKEIGGQTGCSFIYEPGDLRDAPAVSASFGGVPL